MAGKGGARVGAGRKKNAETHAVPIARATDKLAARLQEITSALIEVALGQGFEEKWVPAGLVTRKDVLRRPPHPDRGAGFTSADGVPSGRDGTPLPDDDVWTDDKGKPVTIDVQVYPELAPEVLVLVERKPWKPDVKAIAEVWDRLNGKARQAVELNPGKDGPIEVQFYMPSNGRDTANNPTPAGTPGGVAE
jgi:hypothetical protein